MAQLDNEVPHRDLVERMLASVLRMSGDARRADLKITTSALEEMERAFDLLEEHAQSRKAVLFGSARSRPEEASYKQALEFSSNIADLGFMVITGAGPGIMEAGNRGAGPGRSFGMGIALPFETDANEYIEHDPKMLLFKYFFTRKLAFLKDSHAVVLSPGGFGTHDEGFEVLTLIQTGKAQLMPVVMLQPPDLGYWDNWNDFVRGSLLEKGMISPADLSLFKITDCVEDACAEICGFYRRFHSMRFEGDDLILRLSEPLPEEHLEELSREFSDILSNGGITESKSPEDGLWDRGLRELVHLRMRFDRSSYGRLRQMIDRINEPPVSQQQAPPDCGEGGRMPVETDLNHLPRSGV